MNWPCADPRIGVLHHVPGKTGKIEILDHAPNTHDLVKCLSSWQFLKIMLKRAVALGVGMVTQ